MCCPWAGCRAALGEPASQPASQSVSRLASRSASRSASQPASQDGSKASIRHPAAAATGHTLSLRGCSPRKLGGVGGALLNQLTDPSTPANQPSREPPSCLPSHPFHPESASPFRLPQSPRFCACLSSLQPASNPCGAISKSPCIRRRFVGGQPPAKDIPSGQVCSWPARGFASHSTD